MKPPLSGKAHGEKHTSAGREVSAAKKEHRPEPDADGAKKPEYTEPGSLRIFDLLVPRGERTLKNYFNPRFWNEKRSEYRKLKEKERHDLNVFEVLSSGAQPSIEYYILTVLSCIIATVGLIQDSTATVIGAMIVAPLMTPILAFSLGVIWGDFGLIRTSLGSILKGALLALAISSLLAFMLPVPTLTREILSRTSPSLFDVLVAIASGIVGAYGNANKKISNTIVGIAIAIALMPPLCTVGIGIGTMDVRVVRGAAALFLINLVSMSLAGAIVFWILRIHPYSADREKVTQRALYQIIFSLLILGAISAPLGVYMYRQLVLETEKKHALEALVNADPRFEVLEIKVDEQKDRYVIRVIMAGDGDFNSGEAEKLKNNLLPGFTMVKDLDIQVIKSVRIR